MCMHVPSTCRASIHMAEPSQASDGLTATSRASEGMVHEPKLMAVLDMLSSRVANVEDSAGTAAQVLSQLTTAVQCLVNAKKHDDLIALTTGQKVTVSGELYCGRRVDINVWTTSRLDQTTWRDFFVVRPWMGNTPATPGKAPPKSRALDVLVHNREWIVFKISKPLEDPLSEIMAMVDGFVAEPSKVTQIDIYKVHHGLWHITVAAMENEHAYVQQVWAQKPREEQQDLLRKYEQLHEYGYLAHVFGMLGNTATVHR